MGGMTVALSNLELFIVVKTFPNLEELMGDHGVFWLYAFACFCAIIFTLSYVPETKDKELAKVELQAISLFSIITYHNFRLKTSLQQSLINIHLMTITTLVFVLFETLDHAVDINNID